MFIQPVGYRVQKGIPCCANCLFGSYFGDINEIDRVCICEIMGDSSCLADNAVEPLGICNAYKPNV